MSGAERIRRRRAVPAAVIGVLLVTGAAGGVGDAAAAPSALRQATGPLLLDEDFTGASAIPLFTGYGSACLTGAPSIAGTLASGEHPLTGCPEPQPPGGAVPPGITFPISPPLGAAPNGFLRLTDAIVDQSGAVLFDTAIQATDGVEITFEQWQYGGYSTIPAFPNETADGISFFLVDADTELDAPGAFGGSLGYAQKLPDDAGTVPDDIIPGVDGGYLGFGFDVLGNFFGDWEHRSHGCPADQVSPAGTGFQAPAPGRNMVTVRGPALSADGTEGYCFLGATATPLTPPGPFTSLLLPGQLHGSTAGPVSTNPVTAVTQLEPSRRTVTMLLDPEPDHHITVLIDFHDGRGQQEVLDVTAPDPVPVAVKFGFAASTGAFTDVHLIRTLRMQAIDPEPSLALTKRALPTSDRRVGDAVEYEFTVTNTGGGDVTDIVITDPLIPDISCPRQVLAEADSMICTGSYVLTSADVDRGTVTNTAIASGTGRGGSVVSNEADAVVVLAALANGGAGALPALLATAVAALLAGAALVVRPRSRPRARALGQIGRGGRA